MARKYKNVQGSNDFLVASIFLLLLGLWAVRDGWFPTKKVLEKHPILSESKFEYPGTVDEILCDIGMKVSSNTPLVRLRLGDLDSEQREAERRLSELELELRTLETSWLDDDSGEQAAKLEKEKAEKQELAANLRREIAGMQQDRMKSMLRPEVNGKVQAIAVSIGDLVGEGDLGVVVHAEDHFYAFNKSLAIGSLLGSLICAIIHLKLK